MYSSQTHPRQLSTPVCRKRNHFLCFIIDCNFLTPEQYVWSQTLKYLPRDEISDVLKQDP